MRAWSRPYYYVFAASRTIEHAVGKKSAAFTNALRHLNEQISPQKFEEFRRTGKPPQFELPPKVEPGRNQLINQSATSVLKVLKF